MASNDPSSSLNSTRGLVGRRGTVRGGRLPSLRGPRDLTLGGVQKKTFVPNIPVRPKDRKDEAKEGTSQSEDTGQSSRKEGKGRGRDRGGRGRGERGRGRGGRGRGEREIIQSHSIFEQGPAGENPRSKSSWGSGSDPSERSTTRTSSSIKKEKREPEETKRILDDLLRDDFINETSSSEDPSLIPIKLPLCDLKEELKKELKTEIKIKQEVKDEDESMETETIQKPKYVSPPRPKSAADLFTTLMVPGNEELVLLQLPDTLPGEPPESDDPREKKAVPKPHEEDVLTNPEDELARKLGLCSIQQFSEGYIGKVQVHKSGKTKLLLGNVELDLNLGTPCGFLQDVVSIKINEENKQGDMMVLGHVNNKLVCVPDFDKLMDT